MEKKYLEIIMNGVKVGAFENVTNLRESENEISFDSDDGSLTFTKEGNYWINRNIRCMFQDYNLCGRRSLLRHADQIKADYSQRMRATQSRRMEGQH